MKLPTHYPGEKKRLTDPLTGRSLWQLTDSPASQSIHFYFTENSFALDGGSILFLSDRDTPGALNIFSMRLDSGDMTRLTAYAEPSACSHATKNARGTQLLFWHGRDAVLMDAETGDSLVLYTVPEGFSRGRLSLSCDERTVAIQTNEDVHVEHGVNYAGFAEKMYRVKRSYILTVPTDGSSPASILLRDTAEGGHLQFSPTDPHLLMFCHEGPWHIVQQRIYLLDTRTGEIWPCFRQGPEDSVGHEFFTQDGRIFFDNRGPGHDGTITSDRTQAVARDEDASGFVPYVGLADASGEVLRTYPLPHYFNHYHANSDASLLVADGIDDLALIDLTQAPATILPLCHHGTSWRGQHTHCHPTFSWDDKHILFASDRTGTVQLYLIDTEGR